VALPIVGLAAAVTKARVAGNIPARVAPHMLAPAGQDFPGQAVLATPARAEEYTLIRTIPVTRDLAGNI
jgi:hypothetical protein